MSLAPPTFYRAFRDQGPVLKSRTRLSSGSSAAPALCSSCQTEAVSSGGETEGETGGRTQAPAQTSVLHFLSKLRRHASLEGAGPYFKRWKFDSSHRAASLDAKGSAKRKTSQMQARETSSCRFRSGFRISEEETLSEAEGSE